MHICFSKYPELYKSPDDDGDGDELGEDDEDDIDAEEGAEDGIQFDEEELKVFGEEEERKHSKDKNQKEEEKSPAPPPPQKKTSSPSPSPEHKPLIPPAPGRPAMIWIHRLEKIYLLEKLSILLFNFVKEIFKRDEWILN